MAEQTSAERFEEWFRGFWEAEAAGEYTDESVARAAWDAATAAAEERHGQLLTGSDLRELLAENSALRQRIAELEGGREVEQRALRNALPRLVAADRLAEAVRLTGSHGAGTAVSDALAAYDEATKA